jgi:uncharacterized protein YjbI with pentapeptide repeats
MKRAKLIICVLSIVLAGILLLGTVSSNGQEVQRERLEVWTGTLKDGTEISEDGLSKILIKHKKWGDTKKEEGQLADLNGADLSGARLSGADLSGARLSEANLSKSHLRGADLSGANLIGADLSGAYLSKTNLSGASLRDANLSDAQLFEVNLISADLSGTDLRNALVQGTDLRNANISYANFERSVFEPTNVEGLEFIGAKGFSSISFTKSQAVVKLRKMMKEAGFRHQERQLTAALRKRRFETATFRERVFENIFLDYPTDYGANPWRCLEIFGIVFAIFSIPYIVSLGKEKPDEEGIWMEWASKRMKEKKGQDEPFRLEPKGNSVFFYGMYFSLLSAFHIGWRDLNVGSWIARMQPREYSMKATGWVRVVSGVQSLISIYLLALWALTYFARPFE